jgi:hypothetical protein
MGNNLPTRDIDEALKLVHNRKAPGLDRIHYEFYKLLDILFHQCKGTDRKMFDVLAFLTNLYTDIERYEIVQCSEFNALTSIRKGR